MREHFTHTEVLRDRRLVLQHRRHRSDKKVEREEQKREDRAAPRQGPEAIVLPPRLHQVDGED